MEPPDFPKLTPDGVTELIDTLKADLAAFDGQHGPASQRWQYIQAGMRDSDSKEDHRRLVHELEEVEYNWRRAREPFLKEIMRLVELRAAAWPDKFGPGPVMLGALRDTGAGYGQMRSDVTCWYVARFDGEKVVFEEVPPEQLYVDT